MADISKIKDTNGNTYNLKDASAISGLSVSGKTVTYTKRDGTTGTITTQDTNTTYSVATQSANGLLSSTDKTKLDGIATGANNYSLPNATSSSLGGVKVGSNISVSSGTISLTKDNVTSALGYTPPTSDTNTTYSAGTGISLSGTTFSVNNSGVSPYEANLQWGGKNFSGSYGAIDASMIPSLGANRLEFLKADGIKIEYSRDGGSTWTDYGSTNYNKTALFSNVGSGHGIGKNDSTNKATSNTNKYKLRITVTTDKAGIYTVLNKFAIYLSTNGSSECTCTIDIRTKANLDANANTWTVVANKIPVSGWSGWNIINTTGITTYGNQTSQYANVRFLFEANGGNTNYTGLSISKILGFGGVGWTVPSTMAGTGHLYSYDADQNATFPAKVVGTNIKSKGSATQPVYFDANGVATATTYTLGKSVPSDAKFTDTTYSNATTSANGLMSSTDKTKLDGIASGANNYSLPTATSSTKGGVTIGDNITVSSGKISLSKTNVTTALGYTPPTTNTTYSVATQSANGLLSADDKKKLDGIASGANAYSLPNATSSVLGGVKVGSNITVSSGTISLTKSNVTTALGYTPPTSDTNTWKANSSSSEGYVASGANQANKVWKTDANGNPAWRDEGTSYLTEWTFVNSVTGKTNTISLPSGWKELDIIVQASGNRYYVANTRVTRSSLEKCGLNSNSQYIRCGNGDAKVCVEISTTAFKIDTTSVGSTDYSNSAIAHVFYR